MKLCLPLVLFDDAISDANTGAVGVVLVDHPFSEWFSCRSADSCDWFPDAFCVGSLSPRTPGTTSEPVSLPTAEQSSDTCTCNCRFVSAKVTDHVLYSC